MQSDASHGPGVDAWQLTELITRLRRVLRTALRNQFPHESLPMAQIEILQRLADEPQLRVRELAERHRLAPNTISSLIQQLVTAGLVTRGVDPDDRRAVSVSCTPRGRRALARWVGAHEQLMDAALASSSAADRRKITAALPALARLVANLEQADPGPGLSRSGSAARGST